MKIFAPICRSDDFFKMKVFLALIQSDDVERFGIPQF